MNSIHQVDTGLYLVDLDLPLTGFRQFISCWIYRRNGKTIIVDPGPASSIPVVLEALRLLNIKTLDLILLTHIHLDHAGGTGYLVEQFPKTPVCCHPIGIPHLIDPQKLWDGSLNVLGEIAETYGAPKPVPANILFYIEENQDNPCNIKIFETPGHASHHVCYLVDELLFAGEVAGVMLPVQSWSSQLISRKPGLGTDDQSPPILLDKLGERTGERRVSLAKLDSGETVQPVTSYYLRIATPPVFKYHVYRNSLLKAAQIEAEKICFGHYGLHTFDELLFEQAEQQLKLWMEIIAEFPYSLQEESYRHIFEIILQKDPSLKAFDNLPTDIQQREIYFCLNSIKGMHEYIIRGQ
ncbi:MAG TPA: MBL fold metallo-hydrolase [Calditrichaeota bacterium]|nr:MBL fold metallo-hydrolase [Calditrichota bacterium]